MWDKIKAWFKNSETLVWARLQMFGAAVLAVFSTANFMTFFDNSLTKLQQLTIFGILFFQGLITEVVRRLRSDFDSPPAPPAAPIVPIPPTPVAPTSGAAVKS